MPFLTTHVIVLSLWINLYDRNQLGSPLPFITSIKFSWSYTAPYSTLNLGLGTCWLLKDTRKVCSVGAHIKLKKSNVLLCSQWKPEPPWRGTTVTITQDVLRIWQERSIYFSWSSPNWWCVPLSYKELSNVISWWKINILIVRSIGSK